jgi:nucleotide-binding universal stress UspA family protein
MNELISTPVREHLPGFERLRRPNPIRTILLATDGTSSGESALQNCINLLRGSTGKLVITYFADPKDTAVNEGVACESDAAWRAKGEKVLNALATRARANGITEVVTRLEKYQGEESLNQIAEKVEANMIMLSSHFFQASAAVN